MSVFYKGSDLRYPSDEISSSVHSYGKGKIAGIYFNAGTAYTEAKTPVIRDFLDETIQQLFTDENGRGYRFAPGSCGDEFVTM